MPSKIDLSNPELGFISFILSDAVIDMLLCLYEEKAFEVGSRNTADTVSEDLNLVLERLNEDWLIERTGNSYRLSYSGSIITVKILEMLNSIQAHIPDQERDILIIPGHKHPDLEYSSIRRFYCQNNQLISQILQLPILASMHFPCEHPSYVTLQDIGLIEYSNHDYSLTIDGQVIIAEIQKMAVTIRTIEKFVDFFETHSWESVPEFAVDRIDDLIGAELVCDIPLNFNQGFLFYHDILNEAEHIHGVSSWARANIADTLRERVLEGKEVELIITPELALELLKDPYVEQAKELRHFSNLKFRVSKVPVKVGLTVTDKCLSFGLFTRDGVTYDSIYDLVCRSDEALDWGERLFEYYRANSIPMRDFFLKSCISSVARKIFLQTG